MASTRGDIKAFNARLDDFVRDVRIEASQALTAFVQRAQDEFILETPLGNPALWNPPKWPRGYVPGTARAGWQIIVNGVPVLMAQDLKPEDKISIRNDAPYMEELNRGHSRQAAPGWIDRLLQKLKILSYMPAGPKRRMT